MLSVRALQDMLSSIKLVYFSQFWGMKHLGPVCDIQAYQVMDLHDLVMEKSWNFIIHKVQEPWIKLYTDEILKERDLTYLVKARKPLIQYVILLLYPLQAHFTQTPLSKIFGGQMRSALHQQGSRESATLQPFFTLQLDIQVRP